MMELRHIQCCSRNTPCYCGKLLPFKKEEQEVSSNNILMRSRNAVVLFFTPINVMRVLKVGF